MAAVVTVQNAAYIKHRDSLPHHTSYDLITVRSVHFACIVRDDTGFLTCVLSYFDFFTRTCDMEEGNVLICLYLHICMYERDIIYICICI